MNKVKLGPRNTLYPSLATHDVFVGEIMETHVDEVLLKDGKVDISRLKPLLFDMSSRK